MLFPWLLLAAIHVLWQHATDIVSKGWENIYFEKSVVSPLTEL